MASSADKELVTVERGVEAREEFSANLLQLSTDANFADFTISVGGVKLHCSRIVVAASCPKLKADMENGQMDGTTLDLFPVKVMQHVLEYMCRGKVRIEPELLGDLLAAADYLQMGKLKEQCLAATFNIEITPETLISWYFMALQFDLEHILEQCVTDIAGEFSYVIEGEEFLKLAESDVPLFFELAEADVCTDALLEAALAWVSHDKDQRRHVIADLPKYINFQQCSRQALQQFVEEEAELLDPLPLAKSLLETLITSQKPQPPPRAQSQPQPQPRSQSHPLPTSQTPERRRIIRKVVSESVVAISATKDSDGICYRLDLKSHQMNPFTKIPTPLQNDFSSLCSTPDGFALTGGVDGSCVQYLSTTGAWDRLPNLPRCTTMNASLWISGKLFSIGGRVRRFGFEEPGWRVYYLHSDGNWHQGPALLRLMSFPLVATLDGSTAYVLHRTTGELFFLDLSDSNSVDWKDRYLWSIGQKETTVPIKEATGMVALGERLYVHGDDVTGYYEPFTATWCQVTAPSQHQIPRSLVCHGGKLYLLGEQMEEYDPDHDMWSEIQMNWSLNSGHKVIALQKLE